MGAISPGINLSKKGERRRSSFLTDEVLVAYHKGALLPCGENLTPGTRNPGDTTPCRMTGGNNPV